MQRGRHRTDHWFGAEELAHVHEVLDVGADAAEDAEDGLHEKGRLHPPAVEEVRQVVQMADVVALELEARAAALAELMQHVLDVLRILDPGQELHEHRRVGRRARVARIPGVQAQDRRPGARRADRALGDLGEDDREGGRHRRRMDGACHRAGDDDFRGAAAIANVP